MDKINFYETDEINQKQYEVLKGRGYYLYSLRDWEGTEYGIEPFGQVVVNNIGAMITDKEIPMEDGCIGDREFMEKYAGEELPYENIKDIMEGMRSTNYHFRIQATGLDKYWMWRTYDINIAKKYLDQMLDKLRETYPDVTAYEFGGDTGLDFWDTYMEIERSVFGPETPVR